MLCRNSDQTGSRERIDVPKVLDAFVPIILDRYCRTNFIDRFGCERGEECNEENGMIASKHFGKKKKKRFDGTWRASVLSSFSPHPSITHRFEATRVARFGNPESIIIDSKRMANSQSGRKRGGGREADYRGQTGVTRSA